MRKILTGWFIVSLIGVLISFFLLEELRSHNPYKWLDPNAGSVESRNLWNERKWVYRYLLAGFFISFLTSLGFLIYQKIKERRLKLI